MIKCCPDGKNKVVGSFFNRPSLVKRKEVPLLVLIRPAALLGLDSSVTYQDVEEEQEKKAANRPNQESTGACRLLVPYVLVMSARLHTCCPRMYKQQYCHSRLVFVVTVVVNDDVRVKRRQEHGNRYHDEVIINGSTYCVRINGQK